MGTSADGILGGSGLRAGVEWSTPAHALACAAGVIAEHSASSTEIIRNPHLSVEWARAAVRAPRLLAAVQDAIGPRVAVENTFLVVKWPGGFDVPWHQDGIGATLELDPGRSVSAWLAISDATADNGCLVVAAGSHRGGYLPVSKEAAHSGERGRADQAAGFTSDDSMAVPLRAGSAVLMDSCLLHRSGTNTNNGVRVGLNVRYVAPDGIRRRDPKSPSLDPVSGTGW